MTQRQSIYRQTLRDSRPFIGVVAIVVLCWTTAGFAGATGPGVALKVGAQTLDDPVHLDKTTRARFEVELSSAMFWDNHADLALSVGGASFGTYDSEYIDEIDGVFVEEYYSDSLSIIDVRLAARFYPLGDSSPIRPYVGGGLGYYWFLDFWDDEYYDTVEDPFFPGSYITYVSDDDDVDTLAQGFFPFVTAGFTVPIGDNFEFLFDFQADFEKDDAGFDLSGPIYMFGCRFRF